MTTPEPGQLPAGTIVGGAYRTVSPLSRDGLGGVYVAEHLRSKSPRVLKVLRRELLSSDEQRQCFAREARIGSPIDSEHIVQVLDAGVDASSGMPWIATELPKGETLAHRCRRSPLSFAELRGAIAQLCDALRAGHNAGIVHRDLTPDNLFLAEPGPGAGSPTLKVLDFGLAKIVDAHSRLTGGAGTPLFMAPEQLETGRSVGPTSDLWALGLVAFYALTARHYWRTGTSNPSDVQQVIAEILNDPIVPASQRARELGVELGLPHGFDGWFARCVDRQVERRFASANEAHAALDAILANAPQQPTPQSAPASPLSQATIQENLRNARRLQFAIGGAWALFLALALLQALLRSAC